MKTIPETKFNAPKGWKLKAFKCIQSMSEETLCFEAKLYIDNRLAANVSNHGHGGPDMVYWASPEMELLALETTAKYSDYDVHANFEIAIGDMCNEAELMKEAKKYMKQRKGSNFIVRIFEPEGQQSLIAMRNRHGDIGAYLAEKYGASSFQILIDERDPEMTT